jgi:diadenosine tetraphosphate (Ap4A) HIT family hydrolase
VFHYQSHILPSRLTDGALMNWGHTPGAMARVEEIYNKIMAELN